MLVVIVLRLCWRQRLSVKNIDKVREAVADIKELETDGTLYLSCARPVLHVYLLFELTCFATPCVAVRECERRIRFGRDFDSIMDYFASVGALRRREAELRDLLISDLYLAEKLKDEARVN